MTDRTLREKIAALQRNTYSCGTVWVRLEEVLTILDAHPTDTWITNCCVCGRIIDTREIHEGGDMFGAVVDDGRWACSSLCWDKAPDADQPAHPAPPAIADAPVSDRPGPDAVAEAANVLLNAFTAKGLARIFAERERLNGSLAKAWTFQAMLRYITEGSRP